MPASQVTNLAESATNAAVKAVVSSVPRPKFLAKLYYWAFHYDVTLRDAEEIQAFLRLSAKLEPLCAPTQNPILPENVAECWNSLKFTYPSEKILQFSHVVDVKILRQNYMEKIPADGHVYRDYPLTGAILGLLFSKKVLSVNANHNLAKIFFGYIGAVALELSSIEKATAKFDVVTHLNNTVDIVIGMESVRAFFNDDAYQVLHKISEKLKQFLEKPHLMREAYFIPDAIDSFAENQVELFSSLLRSMLILTEGGNRNDIALDYERIQKGQLSDTDDRIGFSNQNPFEPLLKSLAKFNIELNEQFYRVLQLDERALEMPSLESVKDFIRRSIKKRAMQYTADERSDSSGDSLSHLLEQKKTSDGSGKTLWASTKDEDVIDRSANLLLRIAHWLLFHAYCADEIVTLKLLLSIDGQRWFAQGEEAKYIQQLITQYSTMLTQFQQEVPRICRTLSESTRPGKRSEHGILHLLGDAINATADKIRTTGVNPLLTIEARFLPVVKVVDEIRARFQSRCGGRLHQKFGFEGLRIASISPANAASVDTISSPVIPKHPSTVKSNPHLKRVTELLYQYAALHLYHLKLRDLPPESPILLKSSKPARKYALMHPKYQDDHHHARASWIYDCMSSMESIESLKEVLEYLSDKIQEVKENPILSSHFQSHSADGIDKKLIVMQDIITDAHNALNTDVVSSASAASSTEITNSIVPPVRNASEGSQSTLPIGTDISVHVAAQVQPPIAVPDLNHESASKEPLSAGPISNHNQPIVASSLPSTQENKVQTNSNTGKKPMPTELTTSNNVQLINKSPAYKLVFEIQTILQKIKDMKKELKGEGKLKDKLTPDQTNELEKSRVACCKLNKLDEDQFPSDFHKSLIKEIIEPYHRLISENRKLSNAWHMAWTDRSLYPIRYHLAALGEALMKIQNTKEKLEPEHLRLINCCLAEGLRKTVEALVHHKKANTLYGSLSTGNAKIVPKETVLKEVTVGGKEQYQLINDENDLLRAELEALKKKLAKAEKGEAAAKTREAEAKQKVAQVEAKNNDLIDKIKAYETKIKTQDQAKAEQERRIKKIEGQPISSTNPPVPTPKIHQQLFYQPSAEGAKQFTSNSELVARSTQ